MRASSRATAAWREALEHFERLVTLDPDDRARALGRIEQSQPELYRHVLTLLQADLSAQSQGFLASDAVGALGAFEAATAAGAAPELTAGARLGPYELVRALGAGGMGEVWLARRDHGKFTRDVALKVLRAAHVEPGVRERFLREGRFLAQLSHANIARLYDAGVGPEGKPYLALEYVDGDRIDRWCDARDLGVRERLRLFLQVCRAVAHAHGHLVVHRDLKPGNILVTGDGTVKLLDFGIAKLAQDEPATNDLTALTIAGSRLMTPEFAAPEQVLGAPVTTATDVHSLGALLYVLLSGRSPFGSSGAPAAVVMREVLDKDPAPPSGVADRARRRELRGDLDDIVSRAMRKNPVERYASALALAEDLERHLRHEPVSARAGSRAYRLSRFLMRHRVGVTAAAGVLLAAAAGIAGVLWQASEAREQARIARTEARKATAVKDFLLGIFAANSTSHPDGARARRTTAEELLAIGGEKILTELREEPETRAELMETLARLNLDLQNYERTEALHRERIDYLARSFGADDLRLAAAHVDLGALLRQRGRYDEARNSVERGVEILERRGDRSSELRGRAEAQLGQIAYMAWYGQGSEARARYEAALAIFEKHPDSTRRVDATLGYARTLEKLGRFEDAAAANLRGIALAERIKGPRDVAVAGGNQQLARVRARQFRLEEAEEHLSKAIEIFSFAAGPESGFTVMARFDQGRLFARRGKHRDAAAALERTLALFIAQEGAENVWVQDNRAALAGSLLAIGERDRAEALIREVISVVGADAHERVAAAAALLEAKLASSRGSFDAALVALDRHDRIVTLVIGPESEPLGLSLAERAEVLLRAQRHADARRALERARPLLEREADPAHSAMSRWRLTLAGIDAAERRIDVALRAAREVVAAVESLPNREEHWELESLAHARLAEILTQAGRREEARGELARAAAVRKPHVNR